MSTVTQLDIENKFKNYFAPVPPKKSRWSSIHVPSMYKKMCTHATFLGLCVLQHDKQNIKLSLMGREAESVQTFSMTGEFDATTQYLLYSS